MLTNYTIGDNLYISRLRESNSRPPAYKADAITTMLKRQLLYRQNGDTDRIRTCAGRAQ